MKDVHRESQKIGLEINIDTTKYMANVEENEEEKNNIIKMGTGQIKGYLTS